MNQKGMTLVELIVYIALAVLLLMPIMMLVNNSSTNMARSAVKADMQMSGRDVLNIMYEDIRNTGFKLDPVNYNPKAPATYLKWGSTPTVTNKRDSSSFRPFDGGNGTSIANRYDSLRIIKGRLNAGGTAWVRADTICYYVNRDDSTLVRDSLNSSGSPITSAKKILAKNVIALQFEYSSDLTSWAYSKVTPTANYSDTTDTGLDNKKATKYIKVAFVHRDPKRLAAAKNRTFDIGNATIEIKTQADSLALYERHEIVIPVPNNGLFPPGVAVVNP